MSNCIAVAHQILQSIIFQVETVLPLYITCSDYLLRTVHNCTRGNAFAKTPPMLHRGVHTMDYAPRIHWDNDVGWPYRILKVGQIEKP